VSGSHIGDWEILQHCSELNPPTVNESKDSLQIRCVGVYRPIPISVDIFTSAIKKKKKSHTVVRLYIRIHSEVHSHKISRRAYAKVGIAPCV